MNKKERLMNKAERKPICACVDYTTDEILNEIYEGDKLVSSLGSEYKNTHVIDFKHNKGKQKKSNLFIKTYELSFDLMNSILNNQEFLLAIKMSRFISYDDCIVRIDNNIANIKMISEYTRINYDTVRKTIPKLVEYEIIKKHKIKNDDSKWINCYVMNPYLFFKGTDLNIDIYNLFKNTSYASLEV